MKLGVTIEIQMIKHCVFLLYDSHSQIQSVAPFTNMD